MQIEEQHLNKSAGRWIRKVHTVNGLTQWAAYVLIKGFKDDNLEQIIKYFKTMLPLFEIIEKRQLDLLQFVFGWTADLWFEYFYDQTGG